MSYNGSRIWIFQPSIKEAIFDLKTAMHTMLKLSIITKDNTMKPIHPGRILKRELDARALSPTSLPWLCVYLPAALRK
jgi:hypothetical protein